MAAPGTALRALRRGGARGAARLRPSSWVRGMANGAQSPNHSSAPLAFGKALNASESDRVEQVRAMRQAAAAAGKPVKLRVCGIIERLPILLPDLEPFEIKFMELQQQQQLRKRKIYGKEAFPGWEKKPVRRDELWAYEMLSFGSDKLGPKSYDKEVAEQIKALEDRAAEMEGEDADPGAGSGAAAAAVGPQEVDLQEAVLDDEDMDEMSFSLTTDVQDETMTIDATTFKPRPRVTTADGTGDMRTLRRRLQRRLYLVVKVPGPDGGEPVWRFPSGPYEEGSGEQMFEVAKRHADSMVGEMDVFYITSRPAGHWFEELDEKRSAETGAFAEHTFFFRGERLRGEVDLGEGVLDFAWICNDEVEELVPGYLNDKYWSYAHMFMED